VYQIVHSCQSNKSKTDYIHFDKIDFSFIPLDLLDLIMDCMTKLEEDFDKNQRDKKSAIHPWPKELFI